MPILMVKTKDGMRPVDGNKLVLEDDGLHAVHSSVWTARPGRDPTPKRPGFIRRLIVRVFKKKV
jgi:hypothetical protein